MWTFNSIMDSALWYWYFYLTHGLISGRSSSRTLCVSVPEWGAAVDQSDGFGHVSVLVVSKHATLHPFMEHLHFTLETKSIQHQNFRWSRLSSPFTSFHVNIRTCRPSSSYRPSDSSNSHNPVLSIKLYFNIFNLSQVAQL